MATAPAGGATTYDEVEYPGYTYPQTHPDRLFTLARLFGLSPAPPSHCRVLELGCGDGGNLLPLALALPGSEFVGVDLAQRPITRAERLATSAGLSNVELHQGPLEDLVEGLGQFDYVIAHGVYSWVPPRTRVALLAACRHQLAPDGVAYVSYNAYPGSHLRDMAREILEYHLRGVSEPHERLERAQELMHHIVDANAQTPYARVLREHLGRLLEYSDWLLFHDDLAEICTPFYFHEFMGHAHAHGLQFLSEADIHESRLTDIPQEVAEALARVPDDVVSREQYLDFFKNRMFRQTLLCHREITIERHLDDAILATMAIASQAAPVSDEMDLSSGVQERFETPDGGALETERPLIKAAMLVLSERWPAAVPFPDLVAAARARAADAPPDEDEVLRNVLLQAYLASLVRLWSEPPPVSSRPSERPTSSRLARAQVEQGARVVATLVHTDVTLDDALGRHLLLLLDGTHDRDGLATQLTVGPASSDLPPRQELPEALDHALDRLGRLGLLTA